MKQPNDVVCDRATLMLYTVLKLLTDATVSVHRLAADDDRVSDALASSVMKPAPLVETAAHEDVSTHTYTDDEPVVDVNTTVEAEFEPAFTVKGAYRPIEDGYDEPMQTTTPSSLK